jgi:hypothetical protein
MVWNPNLGPYKNAVTNELYITASIGMYLDFPGDDNDSPFASEGSDAHVPPEKPYDPTYLQNAIDGYTWLKNSNMTNHKGLYTDGFHISDWKGNGTKCDRRNNMVYTYNQGVLLGGLKGLWESTGNISYLQDGHELVLNVIEATGWTRDLPPAANKSKWAGLGRDGILEDHCDAQGRCSQDAQTFKSIYFHNLALFCEPLPEWPRAPGKTFGADKMTAFLHRSSCQKYKTWVAHNAHAALKTQDKHGRFGMWWGVQDEVEAVPLPSGAEDYSNNHTVLLQSQWRRGSSVSWADSIALLQQPQRMTSSEDSKMDDAATESKLKYGPAKSDPNDRGRGRTVETQAGGIAVFRCLWELENMV